MALIFKMAPKRKAGQRAGLTRAKIIDAALKLWDDAGPPSSISPIVTTSSSTRSSAPARLSSQPTRPGASVEASSSIRCTLMIVRRFEAATSSRAVLVETGETFEALATRRALEPTSA